MIEISLWIIIEIFGHFIPFVRLGSTEMSESRAVKVAILDNSGEFQRFYTRGARKK